MSEEVCEGVLLWNASLVLKKYLEEKARAEFAGADVLELGVFTSALKWLPRLHLS